MSRNLLLVLLLVPVLSGCTTFYGPPERFLEAAGRGGGERIGFELPSRVRCLERMELEVEVGRAGFRFASRARHDATDADGDGEGFAARAVFVGPSGRRVVVPGFFAERAGRWRLLVRFAPEEAGAWRVRVEAADARGHRAVSGWKTFAASPSVRPGFLRTTALAGARGRFADDVLVLGRGGEAEPFFGVAAARAWNAPSTPDSPAADWPAQAIDLERDLFGPMQRHGVNLLVYWFAPWETQLVHCGSGPDPWTRYDQARAARMDRVVRLAERYAVTLCLVIWPHPSLRAGDRPWKDGLWSSGPASWQNGFSRFGGGLRCSDFFLSHDGAQGRALELWLHQRNLLRYIVARWGYSPAVGTWCTVCLPQGMTGWRTPQALGRWHDAMVRCLRGYDFTGRPLTAVSWRAPTPWVGGSEPVDIAQFCVYPKGFYSARHTMLDAKMERWIVKRMAARTRQARQSRPGKPVFCGEYGLIERVRPADTVSTHGRRYPRYVRLATWSALLAGAAVLPAEWDDGARFGEHTGRDAAGKVLYDNFAELGAVASFVRGEEGVAGDFGLRFGRERTELALPTVGGVQALGLAFGPTAGGVTELIGWLPRPPKKEAAGGGVLRLPGLRPDARYTGSFRFIPGGMRRPIHIKADGDGEAMLALPGYAGGLAFKLRAIR